MTDDLLLNQSSPSESWQPSAISQINGTDAIDYLTRFAALNSFGTLEPHADWNLLFDNPVLDILDDSYPLWAGGATFYPGDEFSYTFENRSVLQDEWLAIYYDPGDTGPLETGGDFYNFFVLGFYPASYNDSAVSNGTQTGSASSAPTSLAGITNGAFPQPDVYQQGLTETGYLTGYFIHDASLAVLSIPTFWADGEAIEDFTSTIQQFITQSKAAGLTKVLIDLQQNDGGDVLLAYSTFKQFFPSIEPFGGSVMRGQPIADTMGSAITAFWDGMNTSSWEYMAVSADEWIATDRLNAATGNNFSSWAEFFGPHFDGVENFTSVERLNTSSYSFDYSTFGAEDPPAVLLSPYSGEAPYATEDIIMLSDGLCASACSLFMEMMHHDAGVKNVVIGGRPSNGPMQTPSGSRGARSYDLGELDADMNNAIAVLGYQPEEIPNRYDQDVFIYDGGISLRAQVREGETVPLAMQYSAADCRIFLTPNTFNNFTKLWQYAADAMWTSPQLCVQNSTGYATTGTSSALPAPSASQLAALNYTGSGNTLLHTDTNVPFLVNDGPMPDYFPGEAIRVPRAPISPKFAGSYIRDLSKPFVENTPNAPASNKPLKPKAPKFRGCTAPLCGLRRTRRSRRTATGTTQSSQENTKASS